MAGTPADDGMGVWFVAGLEERYSRVAELAGLVVDDEHAGLRVDQGGVHRGRVVHGWTGAEMGSVIWKMVLPGALRSCTEPS